MCIVKQLASHSGAGSPDRTPEMSTALLGCLGEPGPCDTRVPWLVVADKPQVHLARKTSSAGHCTSVVRSLAFHTEGAERC